MGIVTNEIDSVVSIFLDKISPRLIIIVVGANILSGCNTCAIESKRSWELNEIEHNLVAFTRNCGATTNYNTPFYLVRNDESVDDFLNKISDPSFVGYKQGRLFSINRSLKDGVPSVEWQRNDNLVRIGLRKADSHHVDGLGEMEKLFLKHDDVIIVVDFQ